MDTNKLKVLQDIGYKVYRTCDLCEHSEFVGPNMFGTCKIQTYDHLKHSDSTRKLSINRSGGCPKFSMADEMATYIHGFAKLMDNAKL